MVTMEVSDITKLAINNNYYGCHDSCYHDACYHGICDHVPVTMITIILMLVAMVSVLIKCPTCMDIWRHKLEAMRHYPALSRSLKGPFR